MTIFRKTTKKSTAQEKNAIKNIEQKKNVNNLEVSSPAPITFLLLQFCAFHQFLSNHTGLKRVSTYRTRENTMVFFFKDPEPTVPCSINLGVTQDRGPI